MVSSKTIYLAAADALLFTHILFVAFVTIGLLLILVGRLFSWSWVRNPWFRIFHLTGIMVVVLQSWLGVICPLTIWEMEFRSKAGDVVYAGTFISHWLGEILYYEAPDWAVYSLLHHIWLIGSSKLVLGSPFSICQDG